jgi:hypothetical protein
VGADPGGFDQRRVDGDFVADKRIELARLVEAMARGMVPDLGNGLAT